MTFALINLLLAGAPPLLIWNLAETTPAPAPTVQATAQYIVRVGDQEVAADGNIVIEADGEGVEPHVIWMTAEGDFPNAAAGAAGAVRVFHGNDPAFDGSQTMVIQAVDGESAVAAGETPRVVLVGAPAPGNGQGGSSGRTALVRVAPKADAKQEATRGWLGVSVGEVSEALADQLGTEGNGAVILNVVADSPADKAGFQAHDIIVSINGEAVEGETGKTVDLIKSRKPGDTITVSILRDGGPKTLNVTLGSRADMPAQAFTWKFETAPEGQVEESVRTRGKFIAKDPSGQWIVRDLGDLNSGSVLPDNVKMFLPRSGQRTTSVNVEDGKQVIKINVSKDGSSISVTREGEGPIIVERTDAQGAKTEADYDTEEALQTADAEAFELYKNSGSVTMFKLDGGNLFDGNFNFSFDFDPSQLHDNLLQLQGDLDEKLGNAKEAYQKAMEELHAALESSKVDGKLGDLKGLMKLHALEPGQFGFMHAGKARQFFEVRPDGTIESRVRKGDSELVELYKNEADLQKRNPGLYEKYQDLRSDDHE